MTVPGRSELFQTLIDQCETEFQRHIILAQRDQLRKQDRDLRNLERSL